MAVRLQSQLTVRAITPLISGLRVLGHNPAPFLDAAQIDAGLLRDPDARVPAKAVLEIWTRAVETTGDEKLGKQQAKGLASAS
jgi:hypothetical protein